jgi:hypothetical protein
MEGLCRSTIKEPPEANYFIPRPARLSVNKLKERNGDMTFTTIIKGIRGALSLAILTGIAFTMVKESLSPKGGIKSSKFITAKGELKN